MQLLVLLVVTKVTYHLVAILYQFPILFTNIPKVPTWILSPTSCAYLIFKSAAYSISHSIFNRTVHILDSNSAILYMPSQKQVPLSSMGFVSK